MKTQTGFTLIEALVAMAILAVSAASLIGAAEINTRRLDGLEARAAAGWVARNHLAELQIGGLIADELPHRHEMLNRDWRVEVLSTGTDQPDLTRVTISVFPAGGPDSSPNSSLGGRPGTRATAAITHTGFIDTGRRR